MCVGDMRVLWKCDGCSRSGVVVVFDRSEWQAVLDRVHIAHTALSPDCEYSPERIHYSFEPTQEE